jgi:hypothetical protein
MVPTARRGSRSSNAPGPAPGCCQRCGFRPFLSDMARPKKNPRKEAPSPLDPLAGYQPCGTRGPITILEKRPRMIRDIAQALAEGSTRKVAAAKAGTTDACLRQWLKRGEEQSLQGKTTLYTKLLVEVNHAEAHYASKLDEIERRGLVEPRRYDMKHLRWRKALLDPKHNTLPSKSEDEQGAGALAAFQLMSPEEAVRHVQAKLERFLKTEQSRGALEAQLKKAAAGEVASAGG